MFPRIPLELKFILCIGSVIVVSIGALFFYMAHQSTDAIMDQVDRQARVLLQQVIVTRSWVADHGGVYVKEGPEVRANPFLAGRDIVDREGKKYVMRNPALTTRELSEYTARAGLYSFRLSSLLPLNPANRVTPFEERSLRQFADKGFDASREGFSTIDREGGKRVYRRIIPLKVEPGCLGCHARQGYHVGDIRGGLSVTLPLSEADALIARSYFTLVVSAFVIILLVLGSIYLLIQRIILIPVAHLHQVADDLTAGRYSSRAHLSTGDELEKLAHAFNSMTDEIIGGYEAAVKTLAAAVEARDPYTGGHIDRVAKYAVVIAGELGLQAERMPEVELGAVLHDIGKIGIPDSVLRKPGHLDADEVEQMKTHPRKGVEIIASSEFLAPVAGVIMHHHERYDGKGYPCGLKGDEIPIVARILSVADTFDAMTTDRPYRPGLSCAEATAEIRREAGAQFDPQVVEAFFRASERGLLD